MFHCLINVILLMYDNRLKILVGEGYFTEPVLYLIITAITSWFFLTCGDRPGAIVEEKSNEELQIQREEVEEFWKDEERKNNTKGNKLGNLPKATELTNIKNTTLYGDFDYGQAESKRSVDEEELKESNAGNGENIVEEQDEDQHELPPMHFCHKCNIVQEYRTRHCKSCDTCIAKFDHHCFWIGM